MKNSRTTGPRQYFLRAGFVAVLAFSFGNPGHAQSADSQSSTGSGWQFSITPYLWIASLSGTLQTQRSGDASFDASFGDIVSKLHGIPFMGAAEAQYDRFSIVGDLIYLPVGMSLQSRDGTFTSGSVNVKTTIGTVAGLYRVIQSGDNNIEVGAGARAYGLTNALSLQSLKQGSYSFAIWNAWADPILVTRAHVNFGSGFGASIYGDVGGFGAGSKLTWQVVGTIDYQVSNSAILRAGYRYMAIDLELKHDITFDLRMGGPFLGATFRF